MIRSAAATVRRAAAGTRVAVPYRRAVPSVRSSPHRRAAEPQRLELRRPLSNAPSGSHHDFEPKRRAAPTADEVRGSIEKDISSHKVFVYMKGVPSAPQCGFSNHVCRILDAMGTEYGARNVLAEPEVREGIKVFTGWPTLPQVFVAGEFVGGADILTQLYKDGELRKMLETAGAISKA